MQRMIMIHIGKLPEGLYLATSDDVQGLVAQGRTIWETLEIARDVVRKLLESEGVLLKDSEELDQFDYPLVVEA